MPAVTPPLHTLRDSDQGEPELTKRRGWGRGSRRKEGAAETPILILLWLEVGRKETQLKY